MRVLVPRADLAALVGAAVAYAAVTDAPWPMGGQNINDTRAGSSILNPDNVKNLALKGKLTTHGYVSATPAVVGGTLYFPDWAGYMYKVDAETGAVIWSHQPVRDRHAVADRLPADRLRRPRLERGRRCRVHPELRVLLLSRLVSAVDAATGHVLWQKYMVPPGYSHLGIPEGSASTSFYAFSIKGN
jgi:outer membrane protein assembly factor BamB